MGYLWRWEWALNMSAMFLAWVREPPGELMVTKSACVGVYLADCNPALIRCVLHRWEWVHGLANRVID